LDLRGYSALRFRVRSEQPGQYRVRIENPVNKYESANVEFAAGPEFREISIPLSAFTTGVGQATTMVWTLKEEKIGDPFHLVLDDVRFEP
jgi:hypothetical protein